MKKITRNSNPRKVTFSGSVWVGVDVHKKSYSVTVLDENGQVKTFSMSSKPDELAKKLALIGCPIKNVVYEAGPCGFSLYRVLA